MAGSIPKEILNDLGTRFLIHLPNEEKQDPTRLCFQMELAYWFYLDYYAGEGSNLPNLSMRNFTHALFAHTPGLQNYSLRTDEIIDTWKQFKLTVPTYGCILVDKSIEYVLLVQGYCSRGTWGFPKGKVNENEKPYICAAREVHEETGFDCSSLINKNVFLERRVGDHNQRLYIIPGISRDDLFLPQTKKEIRSIRWFNIKDLPTYKKDPTPTDRLGINANNFFMIMPFVKPLRKWMDNHRKAAGITKLPPLLKVLTNDVVASPSKTADVSSSRVQIPEVASLPKPAAETSTVSQSSTTTVSKPAMPTLSQSILGAVSQSSSTNASRSSSAAGVSSGKKKSSNDNSARKSLKKAFDDAAEIQTKESKKQIKKAIPKLPPYKVPEFKVPAWQNFKLDYKELDGDLRKQILTKLFGQNYPDALPDGWRKQNFQFYRTQDRHASFILNQHRGGPCGVIAAVEAYMLRFRFEYSHGSSQRLTLTALRKQAFVLALATIIWNAAGSTGLAYVIVPKCKDGSDVQTYLKSWQVLTATSFKETINIIQGFESTVRKFGVIPFACSVVMTKTIPAIEADQREMLMDGEDLPPLTVDPDYDCAQELVNLLLTGNAVRHSHDGDIDNDEAGMLLKGIRARSDIGFLSEAESSAMTVGNYYKFPSFPIWVLHGNNHYSVLCSLQRELVEVEQSTETDDETKPKISMIWLPGFTKEYYSVEIGGARSDFSPPPDSDLATLEACIRHRWKNVNITVSEFTQDSEPETDGGKSSKQRKRVSPENEKQNGGQEGNVNGSTMAFRRSQRIKKVKVYE